MRSASRPGAHDEPASHAAHPPSASKVDADESGDTGLAGGFELVEVDSGGEEWHVRRLTGVSSTKTYRCPGCEQEIRPATPHVVVWPSLAVDRRRHWHNPCWNARSRLSSRRLRPGR